MYESPWAQKTRGMTFMNQEGRMLQGPSSYNANNFYPQANANWYSLDISYALMYDYCRQNWP